jgi:hypothetical protein
MISYHARMKSIPNSCINYYVGLETNRYKNIMEVYTDLYRGNPITFDLTEGKHKTIFRYNGNYSVRTEQVFNRTIQFFSKNDKKLKR